MYGMSVTQKLLLHTECHNGTIMLLVNTEFYSDKTDFKKNLHTKYHGDIWKLILHSQYHSYCRSFSLSAVTSV